MNFSGSRCKSIHDILFRFWYIKAVDSVPNSGHPTLGMRQDFIVQGESKVGICSRSCDSYHRICRDKGVYFN